MALFREGKGLLHPYDVSRVARREFRRIWVGVAEVVARTLDVEGRIDHSSKDPAPVFNARHVATYPEAQGSCLHILAQAMLADPSYRLVLLDELNIVLRYGYLPVDEVVAALQAKPRDLHVVVTGRNAPPALIEAADLVTEMSLVKHPFRAGVKAQPGIEF